MKVLNRKILPEKIKLLTGDIVLFKPKDFIGRCITKIDRTPYSHVEIIVRNWNVLFSSGSRMSGVTPLPLLKSLEGRFVEIKRAKDIFDEKSMSMYIARRWGTKYDFRGTFWAQLIYQLSNKHIWIGERNGDAERALYCSEYVALCHNEVSNYYPNWWQIDPKTILEDTRFETIWKGQVDEDVIFL